ncbi:MAG: glycosyltransferase family 2 protein [Fimbriimonas ginsengisoli]|uniref:Glycosyltransferase family 2 protein n=1 Tax=Fimbriimonas ginsengisoli TaxID=1005039 RepID=A0A931LX92_FIMGI|nr:glycosyltransferase family 2 protein [Fimbriimonas ginsengisoli]
MSAAKVAILMRTKDRPVFLRRALRSVAAQTFEDWTLAIINDGDRAPVEDAAAETLNDPQRQRLKIVEPVKPLARDGLLQVGLADTESQFVVALDDDDTWEPRFLQDTVAFLDDPDNAAFGGVVAGSRLVFERFAGGALREMRQVDISGWRRDLRLWQMMERNLYPIHAFLYRREIGERIGGYRDLDVLGDWDFNFRFLLEADLGAIDPVLANYHQRSEADAGAAQNTDLQAHRGQQEVLLAEWGGKSEQLRLILEAAASTALLGEELAELEQLIIPPSRLARRLAFLRRSRRRPDEAQERATARSLNASLREDIKAGVLGTGYRANLRAAFDDLTHQAHSLREQMAPVHRLARKFFRLAGKG